MKEYDAVIVGAGMAGSTVALELCLGGMDVLLLEAGRSVPPDFFERISGAKLSFDVRARLACLLRGGPFYRWLALTRYFSSDLWQLIQRSQSEYSTPPDAGFNWVRALAVNGRGNFWGRLCPRFSQEELASCEPDGIGAVWPIRSIHELDEHYESIEALLEVSGPSDVPDEHAYLRTRRGRSASRVVQVARQHLEPELRVYPMRRAEYPAAPLSPMLERALETRRLTLREGALATSIVTTADGTRARGVQFIDIETRRPCVAHGRTIVLAASALESVRLLLNSANDKHPAGLGNSSGLLGRYLMDHVHTKASGRASKVPLFREAAARYLADPSLLGERGFYIAPAHDASSAKGFWRRYQMEGTVFAGRNVSLAACGEMLPSANNRLTIDPSKRDRWGQPAAHIAVRWGANERNMIAHQRAALAHVLRRLGAKGWKVDAPVPGGAIHEAGGARMGDVKDASVVTPHGSLWDAPNVHVCDASVLPSIGFQNTTLTVLALARRSCRHLLERCRTGAI